MGILALLSLAFALGGEEVGVLLILSHVVGRCYACPCAFHSPLGIDNQDGTYQDILEHDEGHDKWSMVLEVLDEIVVQHVDRILYPFSKLE